MRFKLPFLKDGTVKVSLWEVLKNSIGKDLWRITVPVFFNQPLGVLQNCAGVTEYLDLLDQAIYEGDDMKRMAYVAVQLATQYNNVERMGLNKPFNPLLGETFEFVQDGKYKLICEQVSHHPPVSAFYIIGDSGYKKWGNFNTKTSFGVGTMSFSNIFNEYIEMEEHKELFEWEPPTLSFHNLVMGQPYIDVEGTATLRDLKNPDRYAVVKYHKRGWTSKENDFKLEGSVYRAKDDLAFTFSGKWNDHVVLTDT